MKRTERKQLSDAEARLIEVLADAYEPLRVADLVALTGYATRHTSRTLRGLERSKRAIEVGRGQWVGGAS